MLPIYYKYIGKDFEIGFSGREFERGKYVGIPKYLNHLIFMNYSLSLPFSGYLMFHDFSS
jgi:hypothetical protein